ncbi:MAG TPA: DUF2066 domain-containing protein [Rhodanobacteraceae bacterium]
MLRVSWVFLCMLGAAGGAWAASAPTPAPAPAAANSPYSATVPVAGTSDAQRSAAIAAALAQVLKQVSPGFVPGPDVQANASGYVRDYHYRRAASGAGLELQVDFDPGAVGRLVAQGGAGSAPTTPGTPASPASASPAAASAAAGAPAPADASGSAMLWVTGIDSTHAYASLLALLRGDSQLSNVVPVAADHGGLMLQVGFSAPLATVLAALEAPNGHLAQATQPHPGADATLRWMP